MESAQNDSPGAASDRMRSLVSPTALLFIKIYFLMHNFISPPYVVAENKCNKQKLNKRNKDTAEQRNESSQHLT